MIRFGKFLTAFCISFLAFAAIGKAQGKQELAEKTTPQLLEIIKRIGEKEGRTSAEISRLSNSALSYMDMDFISSKTLGKYYKKLSDEERRQYQKLLSDLFIHVAFPNSGKFFAGLDIQFEKTLLKKTKAVTPVLVVHKEEGEVDIEFRLHLADQKWKVIDVDLDGVSMRNNLRTQIYKILKKNDFKELMRRMTKKLKEAKEDS